MACAESSALALTSLQGERIHFAGQSSDLPEFLTTANRLYQSGDHPQVRHALKLADQPEFESFLANSPVRWDVMFLLAKLHYDVNQFDEAEAWNKRILEVCQHGLVFHQLFLICHRNPKRHTEAVMFAEKAFACMSDVSLFRITLARSWAFSGQVDRAIDILEQGLDENPNHPDFGIPLMWWKHFTSPVDRADAMLGYCRYAGNRFSTAAPWPSCRACYPSKRLRVGFISPDFRENSLAYTFEPFLDGVNREGLDCFGYGRMERSDHVTDRMKQKFQCYRDVYGLSAWETARIITDDEIDILVLLGGYVKNNALDVGALKPAPVQVDFGNISTLGLDQVGYRITDELLDPIGSQAHYRETLIYLPNGFFHYRAPDSTPPVNELPALKNGYMTFGSFNSNIKISDMTLSLWAKVLLACPDSRLVLKFRTGGDAQVQSWYKKKLSKRGVDPERIRIVGHASTTHESLKYYHRIDLALDPYPFTGAVTTLESLWMGVPVISLVGQPWCSRMSLTILRAVGLDLFVCSEPTEYIQKAKAFCQQRENLQAIRQSLRGLMQNSPLCDGRAFGRDMENAFRQMWQHACEQSGNT